MSSFLYQQLAGPEDLCYKEDQSPCHLVVYVYKYLYTDKCFSWKI